MLLFSRKQEQAVVIDSPPNFDDLRPRATWLRRRAETLLARFQRSFPAIRYDLAWYSDSVNAQAFLKRKRQWVRLYGGLARHRRITIAGIAYAIAHETGHHLGGAPFDPTYSWLSSESRADEWAIRDGLIQLFGTEKGPSLATQGLRELIALAPADDVGRARRERLLQGEMVERQGFSTDH